MRQSTHYGDQSWLEFALGISPEPQRTAIERHLDEPCEECRTACNFWKTVVETAGRERRYDPPGRNVRLALAAFSAWSLENVSRQRARARLARLVFDSLREALPAGVRAGDAGRRRLLHRIGGWMIDVQLEPQEGDRVALAGQVTPAGKHKPLQMPAEVILVSAGKPVSGTSVDAFGEFQFQFNRMEDMRIYIVIPGEPPIAVTLPNDPNGN